LILSILFSYSLSANSIFSFACYSASLSSLSLNFFSSLLASCCYLDKLFQVFVNQLLYLVSAALYSFYAAAAAALRAITARRVRPVAL